MAELKSIIQFFAVKITESVRRRAANGYGKNEIKYAGQSQHIWQVMGRNTNTYIG